MTESQFQNILTKIRSRPKIKRLFIITCNILPKIIMIIYVVCIVYLIVQVDIRSLKFIIVPLIGLILAIAFRKFFNRSRPFEKYKIQPLIKHDRGESFPSKHAVSSMVIAFACLYINLWLGLIMILLSILIGTTRVIAAIHFPIDVFFGWGLGGLVGYLGCFVVT